MCTRVIAHHGYLWPPTAPEGRNVRARKRSSSDRTDRLPGMEIQAAVTESKGAPFEIRQVQLDEPRADEVLVRVVAAGICHTDLIIRDQWYPVPLPAVLGHEGAGSSRRWAARYPRSRSAITWP